MAEYRKTTHMPPRISMFAIDWQTLKKSLENFSRSFSNLKLKRLLATGKTLVKNFREKIHRSKFFVFQNLTTTGRS